MELWKFISDTAEWIGDVLSYTGIMLAAVGMGKIFIGQFLWDPPLGYDFFLAVMVCITSIGPMILACLMAILSNFAGDRSAQLRAHAVTCRP